MNDAGIEENVCSICLSIGTEYYMLQKKFKWLFDFICTKMHLEISEDSFTCCECLTKLVSLSHFKTLWLGTEDRIRAKVAETNQKLNIADIVYPPFSEALCITNICRLCLSVVEDELFSSISSQIKDISLREMLECAVPELLMDLTYNPLFCDACTKRLNTLYIFNKGCMETENKIKTYLEQSGTNIETTTKIYLLLNAIQHYEEAKDRDKLDYKYSCDVCDYRTFIELALKHHKTEIHTANAITVSMASKSTTTSDMENNAPLRNEAFGDTDNDTEVSIPSDDVQTNSGLNSSASSAADVETGREAANRTPEDTKTGIVEVKCEVPEVYKCNVCTTYETNKKCNLKRHMARQHTKKVKNLSCLICEYKTDSSADLVSHCAEHNPAKNDQYKCHKCVYSTNNQRNLSKHLARHVKRERQVELNELFICPLCPFSAKYIYELSRHMLIHSCDQSFVLTY